MVALGSAVASGNGCCDERQPFFFVTCLYFTKNSALIVRPKKLGHDPIAKACALYRKTLACLDVDRRPWITCYSRQRLGCCTSLGRTALDGPQLTVCPHEPDPTANFDEEWVEFVERYLCGLWPGFEPDQCYPLLSSKSRRALQYLAATYQECGDVTSEPRARFLLGGAQRGSLGYHSRRSCERHRTCPVPSRPLGSAARRAP